MKVAWVRAMDIFCGRLRAHDALHLTRYLYSGAALKRTRNNGIRIYRVIHLSCRILLSLYSLMPSDMDLKLIKSLSHGVQEQEISVSFYFLLMIQFCNKKT